MSRLASIRGAKSERLRLITPSAIVLTTLVLGASTGSAQTRPVNYTSSLGSNVHFFQHWAAEYSLLDTFKQSRPWLAECDATQGQADCTFGNQFDTGEQAQLDLDAQGWVRSLPAPADAPIFWCYGTTIFQDIGSHYPGGQYVVLYDGQGTITYGMGATKNNALSATGRDVVDVVPANGSIYLKICSTDPNHTGNYIRNIHVVPAAYESTYTTQIFHPDWLSKMQRYAAVRYMQWGQTQGSIQKYWNDRPHLEDARYEQPYEGVPWEIMIAASNRLRSDAWLNLPHQVDDQYVTNLATMVRDTLDPSLKVWVEYSNEIWNDAWDYPQGLWAQQQADALWGTGGDPVQRRQSWYGMRSAQICDLWRGVFGAASDRVKCVIASQASNSWVSEQALDCPLWTQGAPCYAHGITALAVAPYMDFHSSDPAILAQIAALATSPSGLDRMFDQIFYGGVIVGGYPGGVLQDTYDQMAASAAVANARHIELVAYEGGTNFVDPTNNRDTLNLFYSLARDARIGTVYDQYLQDWRDIGGHLFMHYANVARYDQLGTVGALEWMDQDHAPKFDALMRFMDNNPCWWGCRCGDGVVDAGETCDDGNRLDGDCCSSSCHIDPATTICRPAAGNCDVAERCTGTTIGCPTNVRVTGVCRPVANACDVAAESCSGSIDTCPADTPRDCSYLANACNAASCDPVVGCTSTPTNENGPCNDGNPATSIDVCSRGVCVAGNPTPVLNALPVNNVPVGSAGGTLTLSGSGFMSTSAVTWGGGTTLRSTYVSPTQLLVTMTAAQFVANGNFNFTVTNAAPGGGSSTRVFTVNNPTPTLTSITPTTGTAGAAFLVITATGTNFVGNSELRFGATTLTPNSRSATQIVAVVPGASLVAGTVSVTVVNPAPGGATTAGQNLVISNPAPTLTSLSPASAPQGGGATTVTLTGTNFVRASTVQMDGVAQATTYISATQLSVVIPSATVASRGTYNLRVVNGTPGGGTSATQAFTVLDPTPVLTSVTPAAATLGDAAATITLNGSNFQTTSVARAGTTALTTTYVSATQLTAVVPATLLNAAGALSITVASGTSVSSAVTFTVNNPIPLLTSLSPQSVVFGAAATTVTITGTGFVLGATARFAGVDLATTYLSSTMVTATIPAASLATLGDYAVTVSNPAPGGGASASLTFTAGNPIPVLSTVSPTAGRTGSAGGVITVTGSQFLATSQVRFNGTPLTTTFVSSTQLTASITSAQVAADGVFPVTVFTPTPGGGTSAARNFTVANNPVPVLTSLSPASIPVGSAAFTLTLNGTSFVAGASMSFNNTIIGATFVSSTQLTVTIPAASVAATGTFNVAAYNNAPGGGWSPNRTFTVTNPTPTLTSLSPSSATAGAAATVVTVNGTSFLSGAQISVGGAALTTTFVSATQLTATIPATSLAAAGSLAVTVTNAAPAAGPSAALTFTVNNPAPTLASASPATGFSGAADTVVTLTGASFVFGATAYLGTTALATAYVSSTQVNATIPAASLAASGTLTLTVTNPAPGGGTTAGVAFTVVPPAPVLTSIAPASVTAGAAATTVTLTGSNFLAGVTATWAGASLTTTFVSSTQITAVVPATSLATAGSFSVTAVNPGGYASAAQTFTVNNPVPVATSIAPTAVPNGNGGGMLTVIGSGFVPASVITFGGANLATNYVSATQVTARLTAANLAVTGSYEVRVVNPAPGGGTSAARTFLVGTYPVPVLSSITPSSATAGAQGLTITLTGSSFINGSVVSINNVQIGTVYVSATSLTAWIPPAQLATAGSYPVLVANPSPGGGSSGSVTFTVNR